ncbi:MAG: hypothetical protein CML68_03660 [Rhodobacteraceae bacterium]|nr:hypothetical protein [Paracoccaceae bacterium]
MSLSSSRRGGQHREPLGHPEPHLRAAAVENGIVDEHGAYKFSFHVQRHAAASLFIEQNGPPKKIQALLGHSSISMTMDVNGHLSRAQKTMSNSSQRWKRICSRRY